MLNKRFTEYYKKIILSKIKQKGLIYVLVKATKRLINFKILIIYPIIFILCIFIRIIKPIFFIRFGCLHAEKFGPLSTRTEMSLCEQEHGLQPKRTDTFNIYKEKGLEMGFSVVESGPLVRSSYHADEQVKRLAHLSVWN